MGSVYQRASDGRWVAVLSRGPRGATRRVTRYAATEAEARALLEEIGGTTSQRFWSKVAKGDGCWEWQSFRIRDGSYGIFVVGSRRIVASRYAYEETFGPIPPGRYVLHRCDNPPCVRPDHLFLGTPADNTHDMLAKGRAGYQRAG